MRKTAQGSAPVPDGTGNIDYSVYMVSPDVEENLDQFKAIFTDDDTIIYRMFESEKGTIRCGAVFIDGMTNRDVINQNIIRPIEESDHSGALTMDRVERSLVSGNDVKREDDFAELVKSVLCGDTVLFVDGMSKALMIGSKGFPSRAVIEPDSEKALKGPREGFNEVLMTNLSLVRRKLQTTDLKFIFSDIGTRSATRVCICYLDSLVDKRMLRELQERLSGIKIDGVLDSNYIGEFIQDHRHSLFKTVGSTEKPDTAAAKLLEGRVVVFVDGSPFVLTVPFLFVENFQSPDDYYLHHVFASVGRIVRVAGFWLTLSVPAIYVALVNYHQEILPASLMYTIAATTAGTPFPTVLECITMLIIFEILRETGMRSSNKMGQALSIVGGLVVGQAAVEAKIVSAPMVIVIALTGITGLIIPKLKAANITIRLLCVIMASMAGLLGFYFVIILLWIHLLSLESFGYPFLQDFFPARRTRPEDTWVRAPMWAMKSRPPFAADRRRR